VVTAEGTGSVGHLYEYTTHGTLVQSTNIETSLGRIFDIAIDSQGNAHLNLGGRPSKLTVYDPTNNTSSTYSFIDWGHPSSAFGGVATHGKYTYLTSALRGSGSYRGGLLRMTTATAEAEFFGPNEDTADVTIGDDGIVYGMYRTLSSSVIRGFDPQTLEMRSEARLALDAFWGIAVDSAGNIYGARRGTQGELDKFLPNGALVKRLQIPEYFGLLDIDFSLDGKMLVFSDEHGNVAFTDPDLTTVSGAFTVPTNGTVYVEYVPAPEPSAICFGVWGLLLLLSVRQVRRT